MLQEIDLRNRDIRYTEGLLVVSVIEMLGESLLGVLMKGLKLEGKHAFTRERIDKMLLIYRDKLFHLDYLPESEKRLHEALSGKSGEMRTKTEDDVASLRKLEALTDRDPMR